MLLKKSIIVFAVLLGIGGCLPKPEPRTGDFNAVVIDTLTGEGVPGVYILIGNTEYFTDLKGRFSLAGLPPGDYQVLLTRKWYEPKSATYKHLGKPGLVSFYLKPPSLPGRIYYSYDEGKNKEIYEIILDNRTLNKVLTLLGSSETNPAWSVSGKLALESALNESRIRLYNLAEKRFDSILGHEYLTGEHPSLDETGFKMVCKIRSNSKLKIALYNLYNNEQIKVYEESGHNPVISPNGTMVAYASGDFTKLYIDTGGSDIVEFSHDGYKLNNPCWSPDGTRIAFEAYKDSEGQRAIYYIMANSPGSGWWQITFPSGEKERHKHPTWGENNMIYFSGNIVYSSRNDIYAVKVGDSPEWIMVSKGPGSKDYPCWGK